MNYQNMYCGVWDFRGEIHGLTALHYDAACDAAVPVETKGGDFCGQSNMAFVGNDMLVSVTELGRGGSVISYRIAENGSLTQLDVLNFESAKLSYISADADRKYVYVSSMGDATVKMIRIFEDGKLELKDEKYLTGHAFSARQLSARIHSCMISPNGKYLAAANLGGDEFALFSVDKEKECLKLSCTIPADAGKGPRHMAFSPSGEYLYGLTEMGCRLYVFSVKNGKLIEKAVYPTLDPSLPQDGQSMPADIIASKDGRFVYVTNRGQNTIAAFHVVEATGYFDDVRFYSAGGDNPRSICFSPDQTGVFVANHTSGSIAVMDRDPETGALSNVREAAKVPMAGCVRVQ